MISLIPDLELWFCNYIREKIKGANLLASVANKEPQELRADKLSKPLVIVRDDGAYQQTAITYSAVLGISVIGSSRRDSELTFRLSRFLFGVLTASSIVEAKNSPICAVVLEGCRSACRINERQDLNRQYFYVTYVISGVLVKED